MLKLGFDQRLDSSVAITSKEMTYSEATVNCQNVKVCFFISAFSTAPRGFAVLPAETTTDIKVSYYSDCL